MTNEKEDIFDRKISLQREAMLYIIGKYISSQVNADEDIDTFLERLKDEVEPFLNRENPETEDSDKERRIKITNRRRYLKNNLLKALEIYRESVGQTDKFTARSYLSKKIDRASIVYIHDHKSLSCMTLPYMDLKEGETYKADIVDLRKKTVYRDRYLSINNRSNINQTLSNGIPGSLYLIIKGILAETGNMFLVFFRNDRKISFIAIKDEAHIRDFFLSKAELLSQKVTIKGEDVRNTLVRILR